MVRVMTTWLWVFIVVAFADIFIYIFFFLTDEDDLCSNCPGDTEADHD